MKEKSTRIVIEFKNTLKQQYQDSNPNAAPNLLIIEISPGENVSLQLNSKNPLKNGEIERFVSTLPVSKRMWEYLKRMKDSSMML